MQDIAGCRVTVQDLDVQNKVASQTQEIFENVTIMDRREQPSYGYRAVHIIIAHANKLIELQIRTFLQHQWAELSEKLSDVVDVAIKYGGGHQEIRHLLTLASESIMELEQAEQMLVEVERKTWQKEVPGDVYAQIETVRQGIADSKKRVPLILDQIAEAAPRIARGNG